jgi:hypothetical protein
MQDTTQQHFKNISTWTRGAFILLFAITFWIVKLAVWAIVVFQFGHALLTGKLNDQLLGISRALVAFMNQILLYVTYTTDTRPFPFADWPRG